MKRNRYNNSGFGPDLSIDELERLVDALVEWAIPDPQAGRDEGAPREAVILPFPPRLRVARATTPVPAHRTHHHRSHRG